MTYLFSFYYCCYDLIEVVSYVILPYKKNEYFPNNFAKCVSERDTGVYIGAIENIYWKWKVWFPCKFRRMEKQANQWDFFVPARILCDESEDGSVLKVLESFDQEPFPRKHPSFSSAGLILHCFSLMHFVQMFKMLHSTHEMPMHELFYTEKRQ